LLVANEGMLVVPKERTDCPYITNWAKAQERLPRLKLGRKKQPPFVPSGLCPDG